MRVVPSSPSQCSLPPAAHFPCLGGWWAPWQRCFSGQESRRWYFCNLVAKTKKKKNENPNQLCVLSCDMLSPPQAGWVQVPVAVWTQLPGLIQLHTQMCPLLLGGLRGNRAVEYATDCMKDPCAVEVLRDTPGCLSGAGWAVKLHSCAIDRGSPLFDLEPEYRFRTETRGFLGDVSQQQWLCCVIREARLEPLICSSLRLSHPPNSLKILCFSHKKQL